VSFEDEISALIDRPCRRDGCTRTLPESCPSDDFCSEVCETTWRAENNGCRVEDYDDFGIDVIVPDGHPAAPSYRSPQEGAFDDQRPPRSFLEYMRRRLSRLFEMEFLSSRTPEGPMGILHATRPAGERRPNPSVGLMQILPSSWRNRQPEGIMQLPVVPPTEVEVHRMREQIARIFGVPLPLISPPPPPRPREIPGEFQVLNDLASPVNFTASPTPELPFNFFRAPGMPLDRAYHVLPPREGEERRAELVHVAIDPATPDAVPLFYTVETRYDHQHDRVVAELVLRVPRPGWANVAFDGIGYIQSVRSRAEEFRQLVHGEWTEPTEDARRLEGAGLERLAGLDAEEIIEQARELGFVGVEPDRDQPET
jgi:hypothetical protein